MLSTALSSRLAAKDIHYGWVVVGVTFLTMLATAGALSAPGVMIVPLQREFGWQNGEISSALAIRLVLFGLMGPFAAAFMNRYGVRPVVGSMVTSPTVKIPKCLSASCLVYSSTKMFAGVSHVLRDWARDHDAGPGRGGARPRT